MAAKKKATTKRTTKKGRAKQRAATQPKVGTKLKRTFKGEEHVVTVAKDGTYRYEGESYRTLTSVAKQITGYASVSGPRFFGLDAKSQKGGEA